VINDPWSELKQSVVLTHAIDERTFEGMFETDPALAEECDLNNSAPFIIQKVFSKDGTLGSHLNVSNVSDAFPKRPHLHWAWNQLVQPHASSWEDSFLCVLEPMEEVDKDGKIFGIAPYDTFSFGPHTLSKNSIILVRLDLFPHVAAHLKDYQGKIVHYSRKLNCRQAVAQALKKYYPNAWPLVDDRGQEYAEKIIGAGGCPPITYLKEPSGYNLQIIKANGEISHPWDAKGYSEARKKKFSGLHMHAPTIELEKDSYLHWLATTPLLRKTFRNSPYYISDLTQPETASQLGIIKVVGLYKKIEAYNNPAANDFMKRYLHKMLLIDYCSKHKKAVTEDIARFFNTENIGLRFLVESVLNLYAVANNTTRINISKRQSILSALKDYKNEHDIALKLFEAYRENDKIRRIDICLEERKYKKAFDGLHDIIDDENENNAIKAIAQLRLAECYTKGFGCKKDPSIAFALLDDLSHQNHNKKVRVFAEFKQAIFLASGLHGHCDQKKAINIFSKIAQQYNWGRLQAAAEFNLLIMDTEPSPSKLFEYIMDVEI